MKKLKFTPELLRAVIEGRKTQTRRIIRNFIPCLERNAEFCRIRKCENECKPKYFGGEICQIDETHLVEITDVRCERVKDIRPHECVSEGIDPAYILLYKAFSKLFDSIYGSGTWQSNPYVWVYEFRLLKE
ncbi:MAG: hypothetical protein LBU90_10275 [Bacteroidales bacterium]|jgi:hypothetical protein|nr:hypothetical protein [Bacteroidales bacterium]